MRALLSNDPELPKEVRSALRVEGNTACGALVKLGVDACDASELLDRPGACCDKPE